MIMREGAFVWPGHGALRYGWQGAGRLRGKRKLGMSRLTF